MSTYLPYWLAANQLPGTMPLTFYTWLKQFANIKELFESSIEEKKLKGFNAEQIQRLQSINWELVESALQWRDNKDQWILCYDDKGYPAQLKEIADPPLVLFVKGNKKALSQQQLALVGARNATMQGIKNAEHFAFSLAKAGCVITSGLAKGIDTASHMGALSAQGVTIGVSGTGLNHIYPKTNAALQTRIIENNGAVISEFPLDLGPRAFNFPKRNRIISGLSVGVFLIEAALKSGSLITAKHAISQNREVFAIPGSIHHPLSRGCHFLIRQGAKLVETLDDLFEELNWLNKTQEKQANDTHLTAEQKQLLAKIDYEITPLDVILLRSRLTASEVSSMLLVLELQGYIQKVAGGYIRTIS